MTVPADYVLYGIGPTVVVVAWAVTWAVLRRVPGWFFVAASVVSLGLLLSPLVTARSRPASTQLDGLEPVTNGLTALGACVVVLVVTGALRLLGPRALSSPHPES